jgi:hypothetical protein
MGEEWLRSSLFGLFSVWGVRMTTPDRSSGFNASPGLDKISGERGSLRLYLSIPKRRIGWSSGKAAGKHPGGLVLCCRLMGSPAGLFSGLN